MAESPGPGPHDKLTTDPPRPPGTPDVDELVRDPGATEQGSAKEERTDPADEDVTSDTVSVEPPD